MQRERTGKTRVFVDSFGGEGDGDVKEGDEEVPMTLQSNVFIFSNLVANHCT